MKYTKEEKIALAKEYLKTGKLDPPPSCKGRWARDHFNSHIREWAKMLSKYGESYFDRHYRQHTLAEKLEVVTYDSVANIVLSMSTLLIALQARSANGCISSALWASMV